MEPHCIEAQGPLSTSYLDVTLRQPKRGYFLLALLDYRRPNSNSPELTQIGLSALTAIAVGPSKLALANRRFSMVVFTQISTLWWQLEDMFQLIGTSQGIERVLFQIIVTPEYFEKYRVKYKAWHKFW